MQYKFTATNSGCERPHDEKIISADSDAGAVEALGFRGEVAENLLAGLEREGYGYSKSSQYGYPYTGYVVERIE